MYCNKVYIICGSDIVLLYIWYTVSSYEKWDIFGSEGHDSKRNYCLTSPPETGVFCVLGVRTLQLLKFIKRKQTGIMFPVNITQCPFFADSSHKIWIMQNGMPLIANYNIWYKRKVLALFCIAKLFLFSFQAIFSLNFWWPFGSHENGFWISEVKCWSKIFQSCAIPNFSRGHNFKIWFDVLNDLRKYFTLDFR